MNATPPAYPTVAHTRATRQIVGVLLVLASGCVTAQVERTGRLRLGDGREGKVPVLSAMPQGFEEVAVVTVEADSLATPERLEKHLVRRASLLGCGAVVGIVHGAEGAKGTCVRRRDPEPSDPDDEDSEMVIVQASDALKRRALEAGSEGEALLRVLAQSDSRAGAERAWPLKWFLSTYPDSAFRADVEALFVPVRMATVGAPIAVRSAPQR